MQSPADGTPAFDTGDEAGYLARVAALRDANWPAEIPREPVYPLGRVPLTEYLRGWARRTPDKAAVLYYGAATTYGELDALSDRFAATLRRRGLAPGDRVAVFLPNCPQFLVVFFGTLKAGCVHVPVNPMFTETELVYELNDSGATLLVAHDQLADVVQRALPRTPVRSVLWTAFADAIPAEPLGPVPAALLQPRVEVPGGEDLMRALREETGPAPAGPADLDAIAALNYTGGTTGMPKGCVHTQWDMVYTSAVMSSISTTIGPDDIVIDFWPVFWVAGQDVGVMLPVFAGATCVLLARWDPDAFMAAVERHRATAAFMLVDNAVQVMEHPRAAEHDLRSLRAVLVASFVKKLNPAFRERWRELTGATLREAAWGMTETHSFDTVTRGWQDGDADLRAQQVFCGLAVPGTEFKIMEFGSDRLVPIGREGELCVRSPSLLKGYWGKPEASAEAIVDGWLRTGDLGMIGERGTVHFLGRRKEMLKVKGMSVFPAEIEAVLGQHPAITGSGVIGREDEARGQVPVAFVTVDPAQPVDAAAIVAFCRERLAVYKLPEVRVVDALPMTATGKVKKEELKALL
ncbi:MAG TPA: AMP-binding protein [Burkholderiaceae bacterium]|nr:AMP-binding protein [Burkholderiaceae bacterium]